MSLVLVGSDKGQLDHVRAQIRRARPRRRGARPRLRRRGRADRPLPARARARVPQPLRPREPAAARGVWRSAVPSIVANVPGARGAARRRRARSSTPTIPPPSRTRSSESAAEPSGIGSSRRGGARAASWTADDYLRGLLAFLDELRAGAAALGLRPPGRISCPACLRAAAPSRPVSAAASGGPARAVEHVDRRGPAPRAAAAARAAARTTHHGSGASGSGPTSRRTSSTTASARSTSRSARRRAGHIRGSVRFFAAEVIREGDVAARHRQRRRVLHRPVPRTALPDRVDGLDVDPGAIETRAADECRCRTSRTTCRDAVSTAVSARAVRRDRLGRRDRPLRAGDDGRPCSMRIAGRARAGRDLLRLRVARRRGHRPSPVLHRTRRPARGCSAAHFPQLWLREVDYRDGRALPTRGLLACVHEPRPS